MAAKLVIVLLVLTIIIALVVGAAFLYFKRKAELSQEERLKEMEHQQEIFDEFDEL